MILKADIHDHIGTITLNRPEERNALNEELRRQLLDAILDFDKNPDIRVIVLTGAGENFCAGGDVKAMNESVKSGAALDLEHRINPTRNKIVLALHGATKPVIAAINGPVAGGGLGLALACDICIASNNAVFSLAFGKLGLHPEWGVSWALPRIVGTARAKELIWTAARFDAQEALEIGLVSRVVSANDLMTEVGQLAKRLSFAAPVTTRLSRHSLQSAGEVELKEALERETHAQMVCTSTKDFKEGVSAFVEKRRPEFKGE